LHQIDQPPFEIHLSRRNDLLMDDVPVHATIQVALDGHVSVDINT
jgi:hypothetical protein